MIRFAQVSDAAEISAIYNHYVKTTTITFEENSVSSEEMSQRIKDVTLNLPWYVFEQDGLVIGYAYATPWRTRSAYRFSVETTVYVSPNQPRRKIGSRLYETLITAGSAPSSTAQGP
jgi:phosphinothricin acetyltransferase